MRHIFDWHPELNIFAKKVRGAIEVKIVKDGEHVVPEPDDVGFVDADDVAEYFFDNQPDLDGVCVKAPWPVTWIEYDLPTPDTHTELFDLIYRNIPGGLQVGAYVFGYDVPEGDRKIMLHDDVGVALVALSDESIDAETIIPLWKQQAERQGRAKAMKILSQKHECHGMQAFHVVMADRNDWQPCGYLVVYLDEHGNVIPEATAEIAAPGDQLTLFATTGPMLMTLGLLNCKNVETRVVQSSKHQNKKLRKHGSPIITRKTLVVHPKGVNYEGSSEPGTGAKRRWHMARGHFKTYREDAPLFGRVTGTFWWRSQVRGSKSRGEVHKDYQVERD